MRLAQIMRRSRNAFPTLTDCWLSTSWPSIKTPVAAGAASRRSVEAQDGCEGAIADLIARYRKSKGKSPERAKMLEWHEAQARAMAGQTDRAIKILQHRPDEETPEAQTYYDEPAALYRNATIAFLENDRPALVAARARLASAA